MGILRFLTRGADVRPGHVEGSYDWAKNASSPSAADGTLIDARWANAVRALIVTAVEGMGVDDSAYSDSLLLQAIQAAQAGNVAVLPDSSLLGDGTVGNPLYVAAASEGGRGAVELATVTEALTGTDTVRAVTPAGAAAAIAAAGGFTTLTPTKGNLAAGNGSAWAPLSVGSNDQVLVADSAQTLGVKWATRAAQDVSYDHTISGLTATNVKTAIDEVASIAGGGDLTSRVAALEAHITAHQIVEPGDIIMTFDAAVKAGFVELYGQTITNGATANPVIAARYSWMVSGNNLIMPDMRGRFLRSWAHGSANDPDRASRTARVGGGTGDLPGTYQADEFKSHYHMVGYYAAVGGGSAITVWYSDGSTYATQETGGAETRPLNINVFYQMKLG